MLYIRRKFFLHVYVCLQAFPLYLTPSLLEQVCNNFIVVEAWHKTPGTTTDDEVIPITTLDQ